MDFDLVLWLESLMKGEWASARDDGDDSPQPAQVPTREEKDSVCPPVNASGPPSCQEKTRVEENLLPKRCEPINKPSFDLDSFEFKADLSAIDLSMSSISASTGCTDILSHYHVEENLQVAPERSDVQAGRLSKKVCQFDSIQIKSSGIISNRSSPASSYKRLGEDDRDKYASPADDVVEQLRAVRALISKGKKFKASRRKLFGRFHRRPSVQTSE